MLKRLGQDIGRSTRWTILQDLARRSVRTLTNTKAKEITAAGVVVERGGEENFLPADTVVIAAGSKSVSRLYEELKGRIEELYLIGDARSPRKALEAVAEGFQAGRTI